LLLSRFDLALLDSGEELIVKVVHGLRDRWSLSVTLQHSAAQADLTGCRHTVAS
jgi:hypothetical protein